MRPLRRRLQVRCLLDGLLITPARLAEGATAIDPLPCRLRGSHAAGSIQRYAEEYFSCRPTLTPPSARSWHSSRA